MLSDFFTNRYKDNMPIAFFKLDWDNDFNERKELSIKHFHKAIEVIYFQRGVFEIYSNGRTFTATAGDIVFFSSNVIHTLWVVKGKPQYLCMCFEMSLFEGENDPEINRIKNGEIYFPDMISDKEIGNRLYNIYDYYNYGRKGWKTSAKGELYGILGRLESNDMLVSNMEVPIGDFCHKAYKYIASKYKEDISTGECCEVFHMSEGVFCRKFKQNFAMTFTEYLTVYRLEKSKVMLETGEFSETEVAFANGFNSLSYFIKKFRLYYGTTPKQVILQAKNK